VPSNLSLQHLTTLHLLVISPAKHNITSSLNLKTNVVLFLVMVLKVVQISRVRVEGATRRGAKGIEALP